MCTHSKANSGSKPAVSNPEHNGLPHILQQSQEPQQRRIYPSGNEDEECVGGPHSADGVVAAVVIVVFNRPDYLKRHIASLLSVHGADPANRHAPQLFVALSVKWKSGLAQLKSLLV